MRSALKRAIPQSKGSTPAKSKIEKSDRNQIKALVAEHTKKAPAATSLRSFLFGLPPKTQNGKPQEAQPAVAEHRGVEIYTWGEGASGQLGHGDDKSRKYPTRVDFLLKKGFTLPSSSSSSPILLSCGLMHTGAVNAQGEVFTWGNNLFMQVGHDISGFMASLGSNEYKPGSLRLLLPKNFVCRSLACGAWHTLIVGDVKGEGGEEDKRVVYVWGNGTHQQLGMETEQTVQKKKGMGSNYQFPVELKPLTLPLSHPSHIKSVAAGITHSCALTNNGEIYMWGNKQIPAPKKVDLGEGKRFKEVACGAYHTLGLTEEGEVYSWGKGKVSNLSIDSTLDPYFFTLSPSAIPLDINGVVKIEIGGQKVISIAAANDFSAAVTDQGNLFVWTSTDTPWLVTELQGKKITTIGISLTHIAAITENGGLYMWRINEEYKPQKKHREELPAHLQVDYTHDPCPSVVPTRIHGELQNKIVTGIKLGWNFALATAIPRAIGIKRRFVK